MKKILALMLVLIMVFALVSCTKTETPASQAPASEAPASEEPAAKNPEDYTGNLVVYSPHDADPLNAGVALFQETYPNIKVDVVAAGTGELLQRIQAESAN
ncbi:MAG TPA: iron ABC transporter substrate-binding protein, partial [Oscillospiraceae bacterium]|nr:iron ABC transporter substrate-binding protein [Oscillospiraceae bacterium]